MKPKLLWACTVAACCSFGCVKTPLVEPLALKSDGPSPVFEAWDGHGIVYALPRTAFDVALSAQKTELQAPVCYAQYPDDSARQTAWQALDLGQAHIENRHRTLFALTGASLSTTPIPDPKAVFVARIPAAKGTASLQINLSPQGTLASLQAETESPALGIVESTLTLGGTLAGKIFAFGSASPQKNDRTECDQMVEQYVARKQELGELRTQPVPFPKETVELYRSEIRAEMASIQALFLGRPSVTAAKFVCRLSPDREGTFPVLTLDHQAGLLGLPGVTCNIPAAFKATSATKDSTLSLRLALADRTLQNAYASRTEAPSNDTGFFFRDPAAAYVSLEGDTQLASTPALLLVPQLGTVRALPRVRGTNPSLAVELYPETGALKSISIRHKGPDFASLARSASSGAGAALDGLKEQRATQAKADADKAVIHDPLTVLSYQRSLLEAELAVESAKRSLELLGSSTVEPGATAGRDVGQVEGMGLGGLRDLAGPGDSLRGQVPPKPLEKLLSQPHHQR